MTRRAGVHFDTRPVASAIPPPVADFFGALRAHCVFVARFLCLTYFRFAIFSSFMLHIRIQSRKVLWKLRKLAYSFVRNRLHSTGNLYP
jgi:hypothetical protein